MEVSNILMSLQGAVETKKERITTYSNNSGSICHMRTMEYGVDVGFLKGAKMVDTYDVLIGKGKAMRVLPIIELNQDVLHHYLDQATQINNR